MSEPPEEYKDGALAFAHNLKLGVPDHPDRRRNPHPAGSPKSRLWWDGFLDAAGEVLRRTKKP